MTLEEDFVRFFGRQPRPIQACILKDLEHCIQNDQTGIFQAQTGTGKTFLEMYAAAKHLLREEDPAGVIFAYPTKKLMMQAMRDMRLNGVPLPCLRSLSAIFGKQTYFCHERLVAFLEHGIEEHTTIHERERVREQLTRLRDQVANAPVYDDFWFTPHDDLWHSYMLEVGLDGRLANRIWKEVQADPDKSCLCNPADCPFVKRTAGIVRGGVVCTTMKYLSVMARYQRHQDGELDMWNRYLIFDEAHDLSKHMSDVHGKGAPPNVSRVFVELITIVGSEYLPGFYAWDAVDMQTCRDLEYSKIAHTVFAEMQLPPVRGQEEEVGRMETEVESLIDVVEDIVHTPSLENDALLPRPRVEMSIQEIREHVCHVVLKRWSRGDPVRTGLYLMLLDDRLTHLLTTRDEDNAIKRMLKLIKNLKKYFECLTLLSWVGDRKTYPFPEYAPIASNSGLEFVPPVRLKGEMMRRHFWPLWKWSPLFMSATLDFEDSFDFFKKINGITDDVRSKLVRTSFGEGLRRLKILTDISRYNSYDLKTHASEIARVVPCYMEGRSALILSPKKKALTYLKWTLERVLPDVQHIMFEDVGRFNQFVRQSTTVAVIYGSVGAVQGINLPGRLNVVAFASPFNIPDAPTNYFKNVKGYDDAPEDVSDALDEEQLFWDRVYRQGIGRLIRDNLRDSGWILFGPGSGTDIQRFREICSKYYNLSE